MINLHPYLGTSGSVQAIASRAKERGIPLIIRTKRPPKRGITVNWGIRKNALVAPDVGLNPLFITSVMCDKLKFFDRIGASALIPPWTRDPGEARGWGMPVVARYKTAASGGEGIVLWDGEAPGVPEFPEQAPLYTKYIKKSHEYRVHVFKNAAGEFEPRQVQRKAAKRNPDNGELEVKNWKIRNLENGFVYVKNDGQPVPDCVSRVAISVMHDHFQDMDFCALDVIYNTHEDRAVVLEGNTAPGLEGSSVDMYLDYFVERAGG